MTKMWRKGCLSQVRYFRARNCLEDLVKSVLEHDFIAGTYWENSITGGVFVRKSDRTSDAEQKHYALFILNNAEHYPDYSTCLDADACTKKLAKIDSSVILKPKLDSSEFINSIPRLSWEATHYVNHYEIGTRKANGIYSDIPMLPLGIHRKTMIQAGCTENRYHQSCINIAINLLKAQRTLIEAELTELLLLPETIWFETINQGRIRVVGLVEANTEINNAYAALRWDMDGRVFSLTTWDCATPELLAQFFSAREKLSMCDPRLCIPILASMLYLMFTERQPFYESSKNAYRRMEEAKAMNEVFAPNIVHFNDNGCKTLHPILFDVLSMMMNNFAKKDFSLTKCIALLERA